VIPRSREIDASRATQKHYFATPQSRVARLNVFCIDATLLLGLDRHAVDAFLPNIEPDAGKEFDALAEAKPHTQFFRTNEKAA
jgi:hypothetical protein